MRAGQYRRTLDRISRNVAEVARSVGRFLQGTALTDDDLADAARVLHPAISAGRNQAHQAAVEFMAGQAKVQGYTETVPVPEPREYKVEAVEKALKKTLTVQGRPPNMEAAVAKTAVRHTEDAARKAVEDTASMSTTEDPKTGETRPIIGWARQLTGAENCPFCVVMASRGAVYHSRQTALYDGGDSGTNTLNDGLNRYHNGCDCVAVPVYDLKKWEGNATARRLYSQVYKAAIDKYPDDDAFTAVRKFMVNDLEDDGLKVPQMRNDEVDLPDQDDVPDFVSTDLLSQETKELIDGVQDRLPDTHEEWEVIRKKSGKTHLQARRDQVAEFYEEKAKASSRRAKDYAKSDPDYAQEYRNQAKKHRAYAKEVRAGKRDEEESVLETVRLNGLDPDEGMGYETDKEGKVLPPQSYLDRVDEVQKVGRSALADYRTAVDMDPEVRRLEKEYADARDEFLDVSEKLAEAESRQMAEQSGNMKDLADDISVDDWLAAISDPGEKTEVSLEVDTLNARLDELRTRRKEAALASERRRGQIMLELVGSRRPMANDSTMTVIPGKRFKEEYGWTETPDDGTLEKIKRASTFFPQEWVEKMEKERGGLVVTTGERGYFRSKNPFSNYAEDQINLSDYGEWHSGSITDAVEKVAVHEIGHRMERTFPAIPRLEWAYLYRRATKNNKRESKKRTASYLPVTEKSFHDEFKNPYTGKVYLEDPDRSPWNEEGWEIFTTGLEALYGQDTRYMDADEDLQSFILGLLLSV